MRKKDNKNPEKPYIEVVVDLEHGGIDASSKTLYFLQCEHAVLGCLAVLDTQLLGQALHDAVGSAQPARGRRANLYEVLAHWFPTSVAIVSLT